MDEEIILQSSPKEIIYYQNTNNIGQNTHNSYANFKHFKLLYFFNFLHFFKIKYIIYFKIGIILIYYLKKLDIIFIKCIYHLHLIYHKKVFYKFCNLVYQAQIMI